jgi:UDP-GlcNAc:undecaprenyl-phosphate GlcNAc-1-phosphate transferase
VQTVGIAFALTLATALVLTPATAAIGRHIGWLDRPDGLRKLHPSPVPPTGGVAIAGAWLAVSVALGVSVPAMLACTAVFVLGTADDRFDLRPRTKLAVELLIGAGLALAGPAIHTVMLPVVGTIPLGALAVPITALWFAGVVNALNLLDGLDGLAGGVALIAASAFAGLLLGLAPAAAIGAAALAGAIAGFLPWNLHQARVFLGDGGALFIGAVLAVTSIEAASAMPTAVPLLVLAVPLFDTALTVVRRAVSRAPLFRADRGHVHHRLLDRGWSAGGVAALLSGCGVGCALAGLFAAGSDLGAVVALVVVGVGAAGLTHHIGYLERRASRRVDQRA